MTSNLRFAQAARARQGGFSIIQPPAPAVYAGIEDSALVIYWTESGPAANLAGVTFDEPFIGGDFNYGTEVFQGQLAARIQNSDEGGSYHPVIDEDVFLVAGDDFTFEYWARTSPATVDGGVFNIILKDQVNNTNTQINTGFPSAELDSQGNPIVYYKLLANVATSEDSVSVNIYSSISAKVNSFNHVAIQKIGPDWYVHLNGQSLPFNDSDRSLGFAFVDGMALEIGLGGSSGVSSVGQIRILKTALYGTGNFTPPTEAFYIPPEIPPE